MSARQLNRGRMHDLVNRCLGRSVTYPAAKPVISDRSDTRRKYGDYRFPITRQQPMDLLQHQCRANRIQGKLVYHRACRNGAHRLFRPRPINLKRTRSNYDQIERAGELCQHLLNRVRIGQVKPIHRSGQARHRNALRLQVIAQCAPDSTRSANYQCGFHQAKARRKPCPFNIPPKFRCDSISRFSFASCAV